MGMIKGKPADDEDENSSSGSPRRARAPAVIPSVPTRALRSLPHRLSETAKGPDLGGNLPGNPEKPAPTRSTGKASSSTKQKEVGNRKSRGTLSFGSVRKTGKMQKKPKNAEEGSADSDGQGNQSIGGSRRGVAASPINQSTVRGKPNVKLTPIKQSVKRTRGKSSTGGKIQPVVAEAEAEESSDADLWNRSVRLRERRSTKKKPTLHQGSDDDEAGVNDGDDNLDFDFSDKDSDFDLDKEIKKQPKKKRGGADSESSEDEWEEVADKKGVADDSEDELMSAGAGPSTSKTAGALEIVMAHPEPNAGRNFDMDKWLGAQLRKRTREMRRNIACVHLLGGLAHGKYLNERIGYNEDLLGKNEHEIG